MKKTTLLSFISKYSLGGLIEIAEWKLNESSISTRFMSDDNNAIGEVSFNIPVEENQDMKEQVSTQFGVANTTFLLKMLNVLDDTVTISMSARSGIVTDTIKISDGNTEVSYMVADPSIIPKVPTPKNLPDPTYDFTFDKIEFIDKFIKAKSAFNDTDIFTLKPKKKGVELVIGNAANKIKLSVKSVDSGTATREISFNAKYFKEMLSANKDMISAKFSVFERGIASIEFIHSDAKIVYFLTEVTIA